MSTPKSIGIFEKRFNKSVSDFHTTTEIEKFIENQFNIILKPTRFFNQNFIRSQGCVFPLESKNIDELLDSSLKEERKWQRQLKK